MLDRVALYCQEGGGVRGHETGGTAVVHVQSSQRRDASEFGPRRRAAVETLLLVQQEFGRDEGRESTDERGTLLVPASLLNEGGR